MPPCDLDPCKNGGTCIDETDRYVCHCPEHWKGKHCDGKFNGTNIIVMMMMVSNNGDGSR